MAKVAILMGSKSDFPVVKPALEALKKFGVETEVRVISAHRTPDEAHSFAKDAEKNGVEVIICAAGKAMMGGLDSLLSIVQMPSGIPVATVGVNGGENAGLLALQILGIRYPEIAHKLKEFKKQMAQKINADDAALQEELKNL